MHALLEKAFQRAAGLPDDAQETIGTLILEEIEMERGWETRFAASQDQLGELVRAARAEVAEEGSLPYDPSDRPGR